MAHSLKKLKSNLRYFTFRVVAISNEKTKYVSVGDSNQYNAEEIKNKSLFKDESAGIIER